MWMESFTDLLPCLFDHMHCSTPDLPVAHTIRELALCRDEYFHLFVNFCWNVSDYRILMYNI